MLGVRIYVDAPADGRAEVSGAFYSRRFIGPFYRWKLNQEAWSVDRVSAADPLATELIATSWKLVPTALQKRIIEHYED